MKLILQPDGSNVCGQSVVAMLMNISLVEAIIRFGHVRGTSPNELFYHLNRHFDMDTNRLTRINKKKALPSLCIVRICWDDVKSGSHWVIYNKGTIYDSCFGKYPYYELNSKNLGGKATSFLKLKQ